MSELTLFQRRVLKALERISTIVEDDEDEAEFWAAELDVLLDTIQSNDGFGTEGQCDPRGDFRDGYWSLSDGPIQGVDR